MEMPSLEELKAKRRLRKEKLKEMFKGLEYYKDYMRDIDRQTEIYIEEHHKMLDVADRKLIKSFGTNVVKTVLLGLLPGTSLFAYFKWKKPQSHWAIKGISLFSAYFFPLMLCKVHISLEQKHISLYLLDKYAANVEEYNRNTLVNYKEYV